MLDSDSSRIAVSPRFRLSKLVPNGQLEDKVDVFEDQVKGWVLDHARALTLPDYKNSQHSGVAVLMILGSYFESIASFTSGESSEGRSEEFFRHGLESVFPDIRKAAEQEDSVNPETIFKSFAGTFYSELRCGLFHEGMIRGKILIRKSQTALGFVVDPATHKIATIVIDPITFLDHVEAHFQNYVANLRDVNKAQLRENFERAWEQRMNRPGPVIPDQW